MVNNNNKTLHERKHETHTLIQIIIIIKKFIENPETWMEINILIKVILHSCYLYICDTAVYIYTHVRTGYIFFKEEAYVSWFSFLEGLLVKSYDLSTIICTIVVSVRTRTFNLCFWGRLICNCSHIIIIFMIIDACNTNRFMLKRKLLFFVKWNVSKKVFNFGV